MVIEYRVTCTRSTKNLPCKTRMMFGVKEIERKEIREDGCVSVFGCCFLFLPQTTSFFDFLILDCVVVGERRVRRRGRKRGRRGKLDLVYHPLPLFPLPRQPEEEEEEAQDHGY